MFGEELIIVIKECGPLRTDGCKCTVTRVPGTFSLRIHGNGDCRCWVDLVYGRGHSTLKQVTPWRNARDDDRDSGVKFAHHTVPNVRSGVGKFCCCTAL